MMVELWTRKRHIGEEDENDMDNTTGYETSGVRLSGLGLENLISELLHAGSVLTPGVSGMVN
jgi:hypothetical protein